MTMTDEVEAKNKYVRPKCPHGQLKWHCGDCGGGSICEHGRRKSICKDCGGVSICEHGREKCKCKDCGGVSICEHGRRKAECKECGGGSICVHGIRKPQCPDCNGSTICEAHGPPYNSGCRTRGNRKYHGFCAHCFANVFPDDPRTLTIQKKSK